MTTLDGLLPVAAALAVVAAARAGRGPRARPRSLAPSSRTRRGSWPLLVAMGVLWSLVVLGLATTVVLAVGGLAARFARSHGRDRRAAADRARAVPELIDLFRLAASAGQPVATAVHTVAPRAPTALRPATEDARRHLQAGGSLADTLTRLGDGLGPGGEELVAALGDAARSGTALVPVLDRVAATARNRRTRAGEEAARRLPVTLLFPLAGCVLPAAVLLAVVPVLAASLGSLGS